MSSFFPRSKELVSPWWWDCWIGPALVWVRCFPSKEVFATKSTNTYWPHCTKLGCLPCSPGLHLDILSKGSTFQGRWEEKGRSLRLWEEPEAASNQYPDLLKNLFFDTGPVPARKNPSRVDTLPPWMVVTFCSGSVMLRLRMWDTCWLCLFCLWGTGGRGVVLFSPEVSG